MKILTMCQGGVSRSVALCYLLKYQYEQDAIACSWEMNSQETRNMLCEWADLIVVMETKFKEHVHERIHHKLQICDVGPDIWGNACDLNLLSKIDSMIHITTRPR